MNLVPQFICIILLHSYPLISVSFNSLNSDDPWASVLAEAEADKEDVSPKEKADGEGDAKEEKDKGKKKAEAAEEAEEV